MVASGVGYGSSWTVEVFDIWVAEDDIGSSFVDGAEAPAPSSSAMIIAAMLRCPLHTQDHFATGWEEMPTVKSGGSFDTVIVLGIGRSIAKCKSLGRNW